MKVFTGIFVTFLLTLIMIPTSHAYESFGLNTEQQACFANAMVGMDSVINSRLGVPAEHALDITRKLGYAPTEAKFDTELLNIVLNAYLWETSPHSYAIKVFYDCASKNSRQQQQASLGHQAP